MGEGSLSQAAQGMRLGGLPSQDTSPLQSTCTHWHNIERPINIPTCVWTVGGRWRRQQKPVHHEKNMQTQTNTHIHTDTHINRCTYTRKHIHICTDTHIEASTHITTCKQTHLQAHIQTHTCTRKDTHINTCAHRNTSMHTYMHTHTPSPEGGSRGIPYSYPQYNGASAYHSHS